MEGELFQTFIEPKFLISISCLVAVMAVILHWMLRAAELGRTSGINQAECISRFTLLYVLPSFVVSSVPF